MVLKIIEKRNITKIFSLLINTQYICRWVKLRDETNYKSIH